LGDTDALCFDKSRRRVVLNGYAILKDAFFLIICVSPGALVFLYALAYLVSRNGRMNPLSVALLAFSTSHVTSAFTLVAAHQHMAPGFMGHVGFWIPVILYFVLFVALALIGKLRWSGDLGGFGFFGALLLVALLGVTQFFIRFEVFTKEFQK
jgi:hypothetical protein